MSTRKTAAREAERLRLLECAKANLGAVAKRILPNGRVRGHHWISADPQRPNDNSMNLSLNLLDGTWKNFHDGKRGWDVIGLIAHASGFGTEEAETALAMMLEPVLRKTHHAD